MSSNTAFVNVYTHNNHHTATLMVAHEHRSAQSFDTRWSMYLNNMSKDPNWGVGDIYIALRAEGWTIIEVACQEVIY